MFSQRLQTRKLESLWESGILPSMLSRTSSGNKRVRSILEKLEKKVWALGLSGSFLERGESCIVKITGLRGLLEWVFLTQKSDQLEALRLGLGLGFAFFGDGWNDMVPQGTAPRPPPFLELRRLRIPPLSPFHPRQNPFLFPHSSSLSTWETFLRYVADCTFSAARSLCILSLSLSL